MLKYVAVDDCGNQINPLIVEGQVHGGVVQGMAQALFEEAVYDDDGNLKTSHAGRLPGAGRLRRPVDHDRPHRHAVSPTNPLGVKGIGEAGTIGAAPAVINAIVDALVRPRRHRRAHARLPAERVDRHPEPRNGGTPVIPAAFDYVRADSAEEAISLLGEHGDEAKFLAGGHSLLPLMKLRLAQPSVLVDIGRLTDLSYIRDGGDHIAIGALTRHRDVETSDLLQAARAAARPRRRPRRRPAGAPPRHDRRLDRPRRSGLRPARPTTLALGGTLRRPGPERHARDRRRPTSSRASSSRRSRPTSCSPRSASRRCGGAGWSFQKFNRRAQDWAIVGVAAVAQQRRRRRRRWSTWARRRSSPRAWSAALAGGASVADAAEQAAADAEPQADLNASVEYRKHLAKVLVRRALEEASA